MQTLPTGPPVRFDTGANGVSESESLGSEAVQRQPSRLKTKPFGAQNIN